MPSLLSLEFNPFPKMARLSRECIITEKIDGTNAQVFITRHQGNHLPPYLAKELTVDGVDYEVYAGSRTRWITPGKTTDNFGFAGWVYENASELVKLGEGRHFGEWWGKGIQRGYGIPTKHFSLFNTSLAGILPLCCNAAPTLYKGLFKTGTAEWALETLLKNGSVASPGFMNPEGIVIYHTAARVAFKKTFDDNHKEAA